MITTEFDNPEPKELRCKGCGEPLHSVPIWTGRIWVYPTCHPGCEERFYEVKVIAKKKVPERFTEFEEALFRDPEALRIAHAFNANSGFKTLAITGEPGRGKSRLMWHVVGRFMEELKKKGKRTAWVDYFIYPDLVTETNKEELTKVKNSYYCFIDDIGSTESYGREKAWLQDIIRTRVQKNRWTFLTIDDTRFDPGFDDLFRQRAVEIIIE